MYRAEVEPRDAGDAEIVAGMAAGHEWAAERLYVRIQNAVDRALVRVLRGRGPNHADLFQGVFEHIVRLLTRRPSPEVNNLVAWSTVVASRLALDSLRRRSREERILYRIAGERSHLYASVDRRLEARSELERAQRVIAQMRAKYAETVVLHDLLGHDVSEVAELTAVSVAAAQSRLVRGRRELMRRFRAKGIGEEAARAVGAEP